MKKNIALFLFLFSVRLIFSNEITNGDFSLFQVDSYITEAFELGDTMSDEDFMRFAFILSEIPNEKIPFYMQKYKTIATNLSKELAPLNLSDFEKGDYILQYLHTNLFISYREHVTNLDALFDKGTFNCVSSSIVYYALAQRLNLNIYGVKTPDHAFCVIKINGNSTDVETTSPYGFNPGEKKEFANSFGQTGFVYTPPSNYRNRTNIGKLALLSLILQNSIVELYKTERYETIVHHAVNIHGLLQTDGSFNAMVNEFANYGAYLAKRKRFDDGIVFFENATLYYGKTQKFEDVSGSLFNNAIANFLSYRSIHQLRQNVQNAKSFFDTYEKYVSIPQEIKHDSQKIIFEASIRVFIEDNTFETSIMEIKTYFNNNRIEQKLYNDLLMYMYSKEINNYMAQKDWQNALSLAKRAMEDTINDYRAKTQLQTVEYNVGAAYHNAFADQYNRQNFTNAQKIINEGLSIVPNHKTLLNDAQILDELKQ